MNLIIRNSWLATTQHVVHESGSTQTDGQVVSFANIKLLPNS